MKTIIKSTAIALSIVASFNVAAKSDGDLHDSASLSFKMDNALVCGVQIGSNNTDTAQGKLFVGVPSISDKDTHGISGVKFINNSGAKEVNVTLTLTPDSKTIGEAANVNNYRLRKTTQSGRDMGYLEFKDGGVTDTFKTTNDIQAANGYKPVLYTEALTESDLPYGDLNYEITLDVECI